MVADHRAALGRRARPGSARAAEPTDRVVHTVQRPLHQGGLQGRGRGGDPRARAEALVQTAAACQHRRANGYFGASEPTLHRGLPTPLLRAALGLVVLLLAVRASTPRSWPIPRYRVTALDDVEGRDARGRVDSCTARALHLNW